MILDKSELELLIFAILLILSCASSWAYDLKPEWHPSQASATLEANTSIQTHESVVNINGSQYREIEYKGEKFFVRFLNKQESLQDEAYCLKPGTAVGDLNQEPYRVRGSFEVASRTEVFIEGLRVKCQKVENLLDLKAEILHKNDDGSKTGLAIDPLAGQVGISLKKKDGNDQKIMLGPGGLGSGIEW